MMFSALTQAANHATDVAGIAKSGGQAGQTIRGLAPNLPKEHVDALLALRAEARARNRGLTNDQVQFTKPSPKPQTMQEQPSATPRTEPEQNLQAQMRQDAKELADYAQFMKEAPAAPKHKVSLKSDEQRFYDLIGPDRAALHQAKTVEEKVAVAQALKAKQAQAEAAQNQALYQRINNLRPPGDAPAWNPHASTSQKMSRIQELQEEKALFAKTELNHLGLPRAQRQEKAAQAVRTLRENRAMKADAARLAKMEKEAGLR